MTQSTAARRRPPPGTPSAGHHAVPGRPVLDASTFKVEPWKIGRIKRYKTNPRRNAEAVADVARSLVEFGWQQPIVVDPDGVIVAGDTRYLAALHLKLDIVPVHVAHDLTATQIKAYRIADNKVGERAEWDLPLLQGEFLGLRDLGADLTLTGFYDFELQPILAGDFNPVHNPNAITAPPGDQWKLIRFDKKQLARVVPAVERARAAFNEPSMSVAESLARICAKYRVR